MVTRINDNNPKRIYMGINVQGLYMQKIVLVLQEKI